MQRSPPWASSRSAAIIGRMRILRCFLIAAASCAAQRPEDQVLAEYRQMEKAEQTGDANTWLALWARESAAHAEQM